MPRLIAVAVFWALGPPACNSKAPVGAEELAIEEIAALDDHDPAYRGHVEQAFEMAGAEAAVELAARAGREIPRFACPAEAPVECGIGHCCPTGLQCVAGGSASERYCANTVSGSAGDPCDATQEGQCKAGLLCTALPRHTGWSGPAICTPECDAPEDCTAMGAGYCCIGGTCHHLGTACESWMSRHALGEELGDDELAEEGIR